MISGITTSFQSGRRATSDKFGFKKNKLIINYDPGVFESYQGTGVTINDISGNNNHGTIVGGPTYESGKFIWTSGDYIRTPDLSSWITAVNENHTLEIWCKPTGNGVVVTYAGQSDPTTGYHHSAIEIVNGQVEFGLWNGSGITSSGPTGSITMGQWHQLVLVYTGVSVKGFVDGVRVAKFNVAWDSPMNSSKSFHIAVGTSDITNQGDGTGFDGEIGLLRVYSRKMKKPDVVNNKKASEDNFQSATKIETFTSTGSTTWKAPKGVRQIEYLVVGGGGGAGNGYDNAGGGGGAGGMVLTGNLTIKPGKRYEISVGNGGAGGADVRANLAGASGESSVFGPITALGGGNGWGSRTGGTGSQAQEGSFAAPLGGYGHGGGGDGAGGGGSAGAGVAGGTSPGAGGAGTASDLTGTSIIYGAGGAGGYNGGPWNGANGTANTGNGGTGGSSPSSNSASGGSGGSGIVCIKYLYGALWNPASDITPAAWLDASDTSSYTLSSSTLNTVSDKAGNFTMSVDGTPTRITGDLNGLNVWDFSGSESLISSNSGPYASSGNHWAIGVFEWHATDSTKDTFWSADGTRTYAVSSGATNGWTGEIDYDGSNSIVSGTAKNDFTTSISSNTWVIVSVVFNKSGNQIFGRLNGTTRTSIDPYSTSMDTNCSDLRFMRNRSGQKLNGRMAEYFHVASTPGTGGTDITDVEKAEGYLAHKWGLTGSLPSNHPYKNYAP